MKDKKTKVILIVAIVLVCIIGFATCMSDTDTGNDPSDTQAPVQGNPSDLPGNPVTGSQGLKLGYSTKEGGYIIMGIGTCTDSQLVIPNVYNGQPVVSIYDAAFTSCSGITSLEIPDGIQTIGDGAFQGCESLAKIKIADSVVSIGSSAFANTAYEQNASNWEGDALYIDNHLIGTTAQLKGYYTVKDGTKCIADRAFFWCAELESVTLPDSVASVGNDVFSSWNVRLRVFHISSNIKRLGDVGFEECSKLVYNEKDGGMYLGNTQNPYIVLVKAKNEAINACTVSETTRIIYHGALKDCAQLTEFIIPQSVVSIGNEAFYACKALQTVYIPNSVEVLGEFVFQYCAMLTNVTLPSTLKELPSGTFSGCGALKEITIPEQARYIGEHAFGYCESLDEITIPASVKLICSNAFYNCSKVTEFTIPTAVTTIQDRAFAGCTSLTSIEVESGNSEYLSIDGNLYSKDGTVLLRFAPGKDAQAFVYPTSVTTIGNFAFENCTAEMIAIPNNITTLGDCCFYNCDNLKSVLFPKTVTKIGENPISACNGIQAVFYEGTYDDIEALELAESSKNLFSYYQSLFYTYLETQPTDPYGHFWHYVDGIPTIWLK